MEDIKNKRKQLVKELKKERNYKTYNERKNAKVVCDCCFVCVDPYYFKQHCLTKSHLKIVERKKINW